MVQSTEKTRTHPMPRALAGSPAVGPAHSPAAPPAFPCPRARNAPNSPRHPEPPSPRATFPGPMGREAPKDPAWMCLRAQQGSAKKRSRDLLQSPAKKRLKAKPGRIPREIPKPLHAAGHSPLPCRGPCPLPCRAAGAPLPASPQRPGYQSQSGHTAAPHHHPEPPSPDRKARHGCVRGHNREAPRGAAGICCKARQRNAARLSLVESTKKSEPIPCRGAPARSPAVGSVHSHAREPVTPPIPQDTSKPWGARDFRGPRRSYFSIVRRQGWAPQRGISTSSTGTARGAPAQRARWRRT